MSASSSSTDSTAKNTNRNKESTTRERERYDDGENRVGECGLIIQTIGAEEVVQGHAEDVDGRCDGLA